MVDGWSYHLGYGEKKLVLTAGKLTLGRSRDCDLSVQEPSISRKHVFLTVGSGRILLQDLGSSNGTLINGQRMAGEAQLHDGDVLQLGDAELRVEIEPSSPQALPDRPPTGEADGAPAGYETDDVTKRIDFSAADLDELRPPRTGLWRRFAAALETLVKRT